ncbi:hypothetical protein B4118_3595 [Bacillus cereus]|nr:hypothetical protein FORC48_5037 [Bacillus cereus]KZD63179.1 hypothetical protein B4118_3595 [Bacillus cereus]CCW04632.1 hypothetical protein EBGED10_13500 [Bacillus sp. GeD10]
MIANRIERNVAMIQKTAIIIGAPPKRIIPFLGKWRSVVPSVII